MSHTVWTEVDRYINEKLVSPDQALDAALEANAAAGLPAIDVSPSQSKLLHLLALIQGARRINESLGQESRVSATAIQTVGSKGYDGFALAVVTDPS